jgi:GT2 family glycosyltransferase
VVAKSVISPDHPICSVCIANFNGMGFIDTVLKSVRAQDYNFPVEIIVHDDASTDGSAEFIRENFPDITLIVSNENVGFCLSNNRMVARARGEYILLLNNDVALFPDALRTLHKQAVTEGKPAILGLPQYDAATGKLIDLGSLFDPFLNTVPNLDADRMEVGMVIGACLWLPKTLWDELGGFPDWLHTLAEDIYLCCLARLQGYTVRVIPDSGFNHWVGGSLGGGKVIHNSLVTSLKRRTLSERNKSFVMVVCYPAPMFQFLFPLHLLLLLLEGMLLSLIKLDKSLFNNIYLATFQALCMNRTKLCSLRQNIQSSKRINWLQFFAVFKIIPHKIIMLVKYGIPKLH